ncbi:hypothetical protein R6Q57_002009, partial [Mikania cordata]
MHFPVSSIVFGLLIFRPLVYAQLDYKFYESTCPNLTIITSSFSSQKDALHNRNSARGFELIESIKVKVEKTCPNIVSCIDMSTLALREVVFL